MLSDGNEVDKTMHACEGHTGVEPTLLTPRGRGLGGDRPTDFIHDSLQLGYGLIAHGPPFQQLLPSLHISLRNQAVLMSENQRQMGWSFLNDKQTSTNSPLMLNLLVD